MSRGFLRRTAACCLSLCLLLGAVPAHAADIRENDITETQIVEQAAPAILPESGYIQPGAVTIEWEAVEGAQRYTLTLDNSLTERAPDLIYTTTRLSQRVNLSVSPEWVCTLTAELADGSVRTEQTVYRTAVLAGGRIVQASLPSRSVSLNLAGTQGTFVPLRFRTAEPAPSLRYEDTDALSAGEIVFGENVPLRAAAEDGGFRLFADGASAGQTIRTQVFVRLEETEELLPAGTLTVRTVSAQPSVSVQPVTLDLFTHENGTRLELSASDGTISSVWIDETTGTGNPHPEWFTLDPELSVLRLSETGVRQAKQGNVSLQLYARVEGFAEPVAAAVRVTLTDHSPSVRLEKSAVTLHPEGTAPFTLRLTLAQDAPAVTGALVVPFESMTAEEQAAYPLNDRFSAWYNGNGGLRLTPSGGLRSGKLLLRVWFEGSSRPVDTVLRVSVSSRSSLTLGASTLTLYRTPIAEESAVSAAYAMQPVNLPSGTVRVVELNGTKEQPLTSLDLRAEDGKLLFTANENTRAGTVRLRVYADNADGYRTLTIRVVDRMPSLRTSVSGRFDLSHPDTLLTVEGVLSNTVLTLSDAALSLSDPRLAIAEAEGNLLRVRWLGGLTKGKRETCTLTAVLPGGITLTSEFSFTPIQSTLLLAFSCGEITVRTGEQATLPLTVNRTGKEAVWETDGACVEVENGVLTAREAGRALVTATAGKHTASIVVWVVDEETVPDGVYTLTNGRLALTAGDTPLASAIDGSASQRWTITHKGGGLYELRADDGRVLTSDSEALFLRYPSGTLDERFRLVPRADGLRICPDGSERSVMLGEGGVLLSDSGLLSLTETSALRAISLGYTGLRLLPGDGMRLSPKTDPAGLEGELLYRSSDEAVVTVDAAGRLSAISPGTAVITVYHPQSSAAAELTVRVGEPAAEIAEEVYRIQNADSGLYLSVHGNGTANGTPVVLAEKTSGSGQLFRARTSNGKLYLYPLCSQNGSGKVLDVYRGSSADAPVQAGCTVDIWSFGDDAAQAWTPSGSGGTYTLALSSDNTLRLTGTGSSVSVEAAGKSGQSWKLIAAVEPDVSESDASAWVNPLAVMTTTQPFGSGFSSSPSYWGHLAWDGVGSTAVMAAADGVVQNILSTAQSSGHGNIVLIRHTLGGRVFYSSYSHLRDGSIRVSVGQRLRAGTVLGEMGATGNVTGRHLHFCVFSGGAHLPYSYCGATFTAAYRDYAGNYRLRYYDPIRVIQSDGGLVREYFYG